MGVKFKNEAVRFSSLTNCQQWTSNVKPKLPDYQVCRTAKMGLKRQAEDARQSPIEKATLFVSFISLVMHVANCFCFYSTIYTIVNYSKVLATCRHAYLCLLHFRITTSGDQRFVYLSNDLLVLIILVTYAGIKAQSKLVWQPFISY